MPARHSFDLLLSGLSSDAQARAASLTDEMDRAQALVQWQHARAMMEVRLSGIEERIGEGKDLGAVQADCWCGRRMIVV